MKTRTIFCLIALLPLSHNLAASQCSGYSNERLISIMTSITALTEQLHMGGVIDSPEYLANVSTLDTLLATQDEQAIDVICQLVTQYPSIEFVLEESERMLASSDALNQMALAQPNARTPQGGNGGGVCLNEQAFDAIRSTVFGLRIVFTVIKGICDTLGCATEACRGPCILNIPTALVLSPFESTVTQSAFTCGSNHYDDMTAFYETTIGVGNGRGSLPTLEEIEESVSTDLLPLLQGATATVAQQDVLVQSSIDLTDRLAAAQQLIDSIDAASIQQSAQRAHYRSIKQRLNIELQLSPGSQSSQVSLQIPFSAGGQLETVREVVADAISTSRDAGIPLNQALVFFNLGDTALNQGKYLSAFESYRDAYRELLR